MHKNPYKSTILYIKREVSTLIHVWFKKKMNLMDLLLKANVTFNI